ncbi:tetratricopeptide repeat protein [Foetidibacter luteolus]|uniref:tetratricopeptide repeat protein n=1 Tax=Foetidibacter luteolus TaxID=2608880 RepID=UPI00129A5E94|nr:tetratricopeptide repeat protein [Foetidibacter luteolus]
MSDKKVQQVEVNDPLLKVQGFWQKFQKPITIAIAAIVILVGGWYAYSEYFSKPNEEKAADALFKAQQYFETDSLNSALNGKDGNRGFLYVIKTYGGTKAGNLAKYYAGVSYLRLGDFNKAVQYLKDFSTDAKQIQMMAYGALGDAYSELKKNDDAVASYKKAASTFEKDETNASEYLFRAGLLSEVNGKTKEALELYKELKEKYPNTDKGFQAEKYIYRLNVEPNEFSVK